MDFLLLQDQNSSKDRIPGVYPLKANSQHPTLQSQGGWLKYLGVWCYTNKPIADPVVLQRTSWFPCKLILIYELGERGKGGGIGWWQGTTMVLISLSDPIDYCLVHGNHLYGLECSAG